jgi:hypothetical protein
MTFGYDGFPSTLITLGRGWPGERNAFWKKRFAAAASRLALRRKSIVAPVESTARYKYVHFPATRTYVSSQRHDAFVFRSSGRQRRFSSGAYR